MCSTYVEPNRPEGHMGLAGDTRGVTKDRAVGQAAERENGAASFYQLVPVPDRPHQSNGGRVAVAT